MGYLYSQIISPSLTNTSLINLMASTLHLLSGDHDVVSRAALTEKNLSSPLLSIPPEVVLHIGRFTTKRYDYRRKIDAHKRGEAFMANSDLTSLASACRGLRVVLFPVLFADISLGSSSRLRSFASAPQHIHALVRSLSIRLDLPLYETWTHDLRSYQHHDRVALATVPAPAPHTPIPNSHSHDPSNLVRVLALILVRTSPSLQSFAFVMQARHWGDGGWGSAWSQFPQIGMMSLDWATRLVGVMRDILNGGETQQSTRISDADAANRKDMTRSDGAGAEVELSFPMLRYLCVDGTADVSDFVRLASGLRTLRLRIPEGFNASDSRSIMEQTLPHLPKLRELEMWIWELGRSAEERTGALSEMAVNCPNLERLSFQTRTFDYADGGMSLRPVDERRFDWQDVAAVLPQLPALIELRLPGSLYENHEQRAFHRRRNLLASPNTSAQRGLDVGFGIGSDTPVGLIWRAVIALARWVQGSPSSLRPLPPRPQSIIPLSSPPRHSHFRNASISSTISATTSHLDSLEEAISTRELLISSQLMQHSPSSKLQLVSWVREEGEESVDYFLDPELDKVVQTYKSDVESLTEVEEYKSHPFDDEDAHEREWRCYPEDEGFFYSRRGLGHPMSWPFWIAEAIITAIPALIFILFLTILPIPLWTVGLATGLYFSARILPSLNYRRFEPYFFGRNSDTARLDLSGISSHGHGSYSFGGVSSSINTVVAALLVVELLTWAVIAGCVVCSTVAIVRTLVAF
ncbi:hypothetical protein FRB96_001566 [Tulasnella sp. 330]|nr:hypothetical protein FRB96_001566 [Tulasnella sp. 330]